MKIPELTLLFCLLNDEWVFLRVESNKQHENWLLSIQHNGARAPSTIIGSLQLSALINISPTIVNTYIETLSCIFSFVVTCSHALVITSLSSSLHHIRILNIACAKNLGGPLISGNKKCLLSGQIRTLEAFSCI